MPQGITKENRSIHSLKAIACILVVLNHFHGDGIIGNILVTISNLGVPVFFLVSGYFLYNSNDAKVLNKLPSKIVHIGKLFLINLGLYICFHIVDSIVIGGNFQNKEFILNEIFSYFSQHSLIKSILWSESIFGAGQWFLIALFEAYIIFFLIFKFHLNKFVERFIWVIVIILFSFHIPVRLIMLKIGISTISSFDLTSTYIVRNVWFDAIPFMLVGYYLHKNYKKQIFSNKILLLVSFVSLLVSIIEAFFCSLPMLRVFCILAQLFLLYQYLLYVLVNRICWHGNMLNILEINCQ